MQLPGWLRDGIEEEAGRFGLSELSAAAEKLSETYRRLELPALDSGVERAAYAVTRLPATYAAVKAVLTEIRTRMPELEPQSLLDIGTGPGTAAWAAWEVFPSLRALTLIDKDRQLIEFGKRLASRSPEAGRTIEWQIADARTAKDFPPHDLVLFSYSIGEFPARQLATAIAPAWEAAAQVLAAIEPGSPGGFGRVRAVRDELVRAGGHIVCPCPHESGCPMPKDDWCHFGQRVERSSIHRRAKRAALGFEDEKFSYIAMAKHSVDLPRARIIRRPIQKPGCIALTLCTPEGAKEVAVTRKSETGFRAARKASWGDTF